MSETFPANTTSGTYLNAQDRSISMQSANTIANTFSAVTVDNNDVYIESNNGNNDNSTINSYVNVQEKAVYINSIDDIANTTSQLNVVCNTTNANTSCGNYIINTDEFRHSFMFSRNDSPGANTRSSISANDNRKLCGMWAFQHDGIPGGSLFSITKVVADNALGSTLIAAEDYNAGVATSVEASHVDKNVVIAAEDTSASIKSSVDVQSGNEGLVHIVVANNVSGGSTQDVALDGKRKQAVLRSSNSTDRTQSTLVLQESDGGVARITTSDHRDGSKTVIDVNNAARKVNFITNDGAGSKSYFQVENTATTKAILMVSDNADGLTKLAVDNKNRLINIRSNGKQNNTYSRLVVSDGGREVLGEIKDNVSGDATSFRLNPNAFAVVAPSMTINGKTVLTHDDLTGILSRINALEANH